MDDPDIAAHLRGNAAVGSIAGARIYAGILPQRIASLAQHFPAAVFQRVGGASLIDSCGADGFVPGEFQIDSYGITRASALALAGAIRRAMVDYSGPMGSTQTQNVTLTSDFDVDADPEPGLFRRTQTFRIWYEEPP